MYGNYSSGITISLIIHNYYSDYPTLYLNLKALKGSFQTKGYTAILPNEAINICFKGNKTFNDFKRKIKEIYKINYNNFGTYIISIINSFSELKALIFLDQYSHELFENDFIIELKNILNSNNRKLKVLLINSMNDKWIRKIYIDSILNFFKGINKNEEIEFIFLKRLINKENLPFKQIDENLRSYLGLFEYLPLYFSLIMKNKTNIDTFISETKKGIKNKIKKFLEENNYEYQ